MIGLYDKNFPVEMNPFIKVTSPTQLRIVYGIVHMEFNLLMENRAYLDSFMMFYRKNNSFQPIPFFYEFWHFHSRGNVEVIQRNGNESASDLSGVHLKNVSCF